MQMNAKHLPSYEEWVEVFAKSSTHMMNIAKMMDYPWDIDSPPNEPRALHNMYARALGCAYARKFGEMCKSISESLRSEQFLLYALAARSLIETTATLRYYIRHEYRPLLSKGEMSQQEMKQLLDADDRHLRGGRFDWQSFLSGKYGEMVEEARRELAHKKASKGKKYLPPNLMNEQRNVYTCIEKWATEEPGALLTYNLFCELVHPNVGSNFLVASTEGGKMHFGSGRGESLGRRIAAQSVPFLGSLVIKEFGDSWLLLASSTWTEDELALARQDGAGEWAEMSGVEPKTAPHKRQVLSATLSMTTRSKVHEPPARSVLSLSSLSP
jgi:hypothetical protein